MTYLFSSAYEWRKNDVIDALPWCSVSRKRSVEFALVDVLVNFREISQLSQDAEQAKYEDRCVEFVVVSVENFARIFEPMF